MNCPSCGLESSPSDRFCRACGAPASSVSQAPTAAIGSPSAPAAAAAAIPAPVGRLISSDSLPVGGFTPGMVLAGRYRIIGLIGRGGMGEVYRADDLKLGQPVALKFLPKALADDSVRRERLFAEVRIARQVSHPNIARVYDISEFEGRHFLTMEYIDGEDLASLLKRIGSLHGAKALDVARQLCAGLMAAHDKGVLHRDLKPANVMIDGRGRVRITDFGLAVAAGEEMPEADVSGTPPYMAPEQFAGKGASVRSDIYALGLIFYEVFTGRRAFDEKTLAELRQKKETSSPAAPSEIARDIDPIVERVILRCIERDPRQRPASAAQVAAALPGGDPLAAAIAAGETPSPEMVAASGSTEGLKPWIAWTCLASLILCIGIFVILGRQNDFLRRVSMEQPPEVLTKTAQDILKKFGYADAPADRASSFFSAGEYIAHVRKTDRSPRRFEKMPALALQFWYRQSPRLLFHVGPSSGIELDDPPVTNEGEAVVWLDCRGRLTGLHVIPAKKSAQSDVVRQTDWSASLFEAAGLDKAKYTEVEAESIPAVYADTRKAWKGPLPDLPGTAVRIEAAALDGKPVSWRLIVPSWDNFSTGTLPSVQPLRGTGEKAPYVIGNVGLLLLLLVGPAFLARRNLRLGRGDRSGAVRLAWFIICLQAAAWVFQEHHLASSSYEVSLFILSAAIWLFAAGYIWVMYIAIEPYARRRWPGMLVGWSRLLAGNYRDPLVGRDLLLGALTMAVFMALTSVITLVSDSLGAPQSVPNVPALSLFSGSWRIFAEILRLIVLSTLMGLAIAFTFLLLRVLLRSTWAAAIVSLLLPSVLFALTTQEQLAAFLILALVIGSSLFVLLRFGILALIAFLFSLRIAYTFPVIQLSGWYSGIGLTGLALLVALAVYAFHTSLGGQPLFGRASLED